ncbi:MAG: alpha/beta hydrolase [Nannocystaceae bacterium]
MTSPIREIQANGLRFAYLEEGAGPLVLLLHGFPDTARAWDDLRPRLASRGFRVVSPWMRGYSPTEIPGRDADVETLARDVLGLIEALGEADAIVVGHDWGAAASYGAAALEPARVRQLVTVAIPHPATLRPTLKKLWGVRHFLAYKLPGAARRFAADDFAALPAIYRRWSPTWDPDPQELAAVREAFADPRCLDAAFGYYRQLSLRPEPFLRRRITTPTVVFAGLDDGVATLDDYERAARMFTGGYTIEAMPGGHFMHREHPEDFAERLLRHL